MNSTTLSTILDRMNRYQQLASIEEQYKVRDLDEALRTLRRDYQFPWNLQKGSLKIFSDVLEYPTPSDFDSLGYMDNNQTSDLGSLDYGNRARFRYTSIQQFYENPDDRNDLAEIWDGGTKYLGVRYQPLNSTGQLIDNAETAANWTGSGDAGTPVLDTVNFKEGNGSMRIPITYSTGTATVSSSVTSFSDANYKRKYYFVWVYPTTVPTAVSLRLGNDSSNYLATSVTAQFSGQAFKANTWNLLAFDLNTATETGTFSSTAIDYQALVFTVTATSTIYVDASYLRQWELMDLWYYSKYNCLTNGASAADQEYFFATAGTYSTDTSLIGDSQFADTVMYDAILTSVTDTENSNLFTAIKAKRDMAWSSLLNNYPSLKPSITTLKYRFKTEFNTPDNDT